MLRLKFRAKSRKPAICPHFPAFYLTHSINKILSESKHTLRQIYIIGEKKKGYQIMPAIASHNSIMAVKSENAGEVARSNGGSTPQKRRLRSDAAAVENMSPISTPMKLKSPRRCVNSSPNSGANVSNLALNNIRFTD